MINALEQSVAEVYSSLLEQDAGYCRCARCHDDVIALALNHARPRYMTDTRLGSALTRVALSQESARAEVTVIVFNAMRTVAKSPRHDRD
jgi:competence protein ComFB